MSNKSTKVKMSHSHRQGRYQMRLFLNRFTVTEGGRKIPIKNYLINQEIKNYDEIVIFPSRFGHIQDKTKVILCYLMCRHIMIPITLNDITTHQSLIYWCGFSNDREAQRELRDAVWQLHKPTNDIDDMFITISGPRKESEKDWPMLSFGIYDILPRDIIDRASAMNWRMTISNEVDPNKLKARPQAKLYTNSEMANVLMNIPVVLYSLHMRRIKAEETHYVDVRDLRNTQLVYVHGESLYGRKNACQSPLDIFDAMLAFQQKWKVSGDLVKLPCLPRPVFYSRNDIIRLDLSEPVDTKSVTRLENVFPYLTKKSKEEILQKEFPFARIGDSRAMEEELSKRSGSSFFTDPVHGCAEEKFAPGNCMKIKSQLWTTIPRPVEF